MELICDTRKVKVNNNIIVELLPLLGRAIYRQQSIV